MACAEVCFEALSGIQPCLVYQSYMSHTTVIWSGAVSTRRCYSCSIASSARWKKSRDWLIDQDGSAVLPAFNESNFLLKHLFLLKMFLKNNLLQNVSGKWLNLSFSEIKKKKKSKLDDFWFKYYYTDGKEKQMTKQTISSHIFCLFNKKNETGIILITFKPTETTTTKKKQYIISAHFQSLKSNIA